MLNERIISDEELRNIYGGGGKRCDVAVACIGCPACARKFGGNQNGASRKKKSLVKKIIDAISFIHS